MAGKRDIGRRIDRLDRDEADPGDDWTARFERYCRAKMEAVRGEREDYPDLLDFFPSYADPEAVRAFAGRQMANAGQRVAQAREQPGARLREDGDG